VFSRPGVIGKGELLFEGVSDRGDLVFPVTDDPQGPAAGGHPPAGDDVLGDRGQPEQVPELVADGLVLPEQDLGVGQVQ